MKRIVGFGGATFAQVLWTRNGACVVYPCHAVIVSMEVTTGHQRFFVGHTDKVCLRFPPVVTLDQQEMILTGPLGRTV